VIALLLIAPHLPTRWGCLEGLAALAGGGWCGLNCWRCRQAHCMVNAAGRLALGACVFVEVGVGRSRIAG
jgi:hypothetical protein